MAAGAEEPGSPPVPAEASIPHQELAAQLDAYVDALLGAVPADQCTHPDSAYVELLVGLASAADALRVLYTDDPSFSHHATIAIRALANIPPDRPRNDP